MTVAKDELLAIMRSRFDYYSARAVLERALDESQIEDKDSYPEAEVARLAETLQTIESRMDAVVARIAALAGGVKAAPEPEAAPAPESARDRGPNPPREARSGPKEVPHVMRPPAPAPAVTLTLAGVDMADGGQALVCGGCAALGDWEPTKAAAMRRDGGCWTLSLDLDPGSKIELKFLWRDADGEVTWEAGENRVLEVGDEGASLDAEWHAE